MNALPVTFWFSSNKLIIIPLKSFIKYVCHSFLLLKSNLLNCNTIIDKECTHFEKYHLNFPQVPNKISGIVSF